MSSRKQALTFVVVTFVATWSLELLVIRSGGLTSSSGFALMWIPGVAGLALSMAFGHKLKDIGFEFGDWRWYAIGYAAPAVTAVLILGSLVLFGLGEFDWALVDKAGIVGALGRLAAHGLHRSSLVTGLIWAVWHWPLILFSNYATSDHPLVSVVLFSIVAISLSVFMGWLRVRSGSVFVAAIVQGTHNLWIQALYPAFLKKGPLDPIFGGEAGVFNAVFYLILALVVLIKVRPETRRL